MTKIYTLEQIRDVVDSVDFTQAIEDGFVAYSEGKVVVPPVGELTFEDPPGDTHIKYGYIRGGDYYVIKIASGFYKNLDLGLPSSSGLMLMFSQKTGILDTILIDEGYLTNVRTAIAGQVAARYLAPTQVTKIGVFGTGTMARMQVEYLRPVTDCRHVVVWGRSEESLQRYKRDMEEKGYHVETTTEARDVAGSCNLIVMTTPSRVPLLSAELVKAGTHITAMGSDTAEKQELDSEILGMADMVVADSIVQCHERGEIARAMENGDLPADRIVELGNVIAAGGRGRTSDAQITVADLTGVAIQDIQITKAVCEALSEQTEMKN